MKIALSIPGSGGTPIKIDDGLPPGVPTGELFGAGTNIIAAFLDLVIVLTLVYTTWQIITGGMEMIMSTGEKGRMQHSRDKVIWAILGLLIIFGSFFALNTLGHIFGVNLFFFFNATP